VKGPQEMKGTNIDGVLAFPEPLGAGNIYKTGGTKAKRAYISAGITTYTIR